METKEFVRKCGELLAAAKSDLIKCELVKGGDIYVRESMKQYEHYESNDDYVLVTCANGYSYKLNVTCNSLTATAAEIFDKMQYK